MVKWILLLRDGGDRADAIVPTTGYIPSSVTVSTTLHDEVSTSVISVFVSPHLPVFTTRFQLVTAHSIVPIHARDRTTAVVPARVAIVRPIFALVPDTSGTIFCFRTRLRTISWTRRTTIQGCDFRDPFFRETTRGLPTVRRTLRIRVVAFAVDRTIFCFTRRLATVLRVASIFLFTIRPTTSRLRPPTDVFTIDRSRFLGA